MEKLQPYIDQGITMLVEYAPSFLMAILTLIIGLWVIKGLTNLANKVMEKQEVDPTLRPFLISMKNVLLKALLIISVASMVGIETTSFVAVLGAAGLAVGLALQGSLGNFAGGVLLLIFRPFKVGDLVEAQGVIGNVESISIFTTTLLTPDNKTAIIPNGPMSNGNIVNFSKAGKIRVDLIIGIAYDADIRVARDVAVQAMLMDDKVMKDPAPSVSVSNLGDSAVELAVRPYCTVEDYWDVYFGTLENVKVAFDQAGIGIPFPQMDVHMQKEA